MKKILSLIMIGVLSLCFIKGVNAKIYDINEIIPIYERLSKANLFEVKAKYDAEKEKLLIYSTEDEEKPIFAFDYDGKSISYIDNDSVVSNTDERFKADVISIYNIFIAIESTFNAMGYVDVIMDEDEAEKIFSNYDKYGIILKAEEYEFSYDDDATSGSISGAIIREFRLSLDSDKIDNLVHDFSLPALTFVPSIKPKKITENSVTFDIDSNYSDNSQDNKLKYNVYRSENEDYGFEKISEKNFTYASTSEITDTNLEPGKIYYYKVEFLNSETPSKVIKVDTLSSSAGNEENNENENINQNENENSNNKTSETENTGKQNPNTGVFYPAIAIIALFISGIVIKNLTNKKSLFKRL